METLNGKILNNFQLQNSLVRIGDIVNFDGPLLALFQNINNKHLFLFDWVEKNKDFNRWIIYRCNPKILFKFIREEISHYDLFLSDELVCFKVDIDKYLKWHNPIEINKNNLPISYMPTKDDFFEKCDCPNFTKLEHFLNQAIESQKQENLIINSVPYIQKEIWTSKQYLTQKYYSPTKKLVSNHIKRVHYDTQITKYTTIILDTQPISNQLKKYKLNHVQASH